jgi:hypothetical protein
VHHDVGGLRLLFVVDSIGDPTCRVLAYSVAFLTAKHHDPLLFFRFLFRGNLRQATSRKGGRRTWGKLTERALRAKRRVNPCVRRPLDRERASAAEVFCPFVLGPRSLTERLPQASRRIVGRSVALLG